MELSKYIPLDKSWIIRMGVLDMVHGYEDIHKFLSSQENLGDDLLALKRAAVVWKSDEPVDVGESGTLYRFLRFASWKLNLNKKFILHGTLPQRKVVDDPEIVHLTQKELLKLDSGTSQWASVAALLGDSERLTNPPFKLALTYEAVEHWNTQRAKGLVWEPRYDETIQKQASAYQSLLNGKAVKFDPKQGEDFCFAYIFGFITAEDGEKKWPAEREHESDRIKEAVEMLNKAKEGKEIESKDHRMVQALAMWGRVNNKEVNFMYPGAVNKSWPQFWQFMKNSKI